MPHLFDTNCFLRLAEKNSPHRQIVLGALRKLNADGKIVCYTPQVLAEFWNVCTRPATIRGGLGLSIEHTERKAKLIEKYFRFLPDNRATFTEWRKLVLGYRIAGVRVHDAKLAASMIAHNIQTLVTFNKKDFQRFPMIIVFDPSEI